ncbi:hypothetical protein N9D31_00285 [Oligoflexaceae bacterium]|nr:hypothetical protein [Oligoflexaceae bacterium]
MKIYMLFLVAALLSFLPSCQTENAVNALSGQPREVKPSACGEKFLSQVKEGRYRVLKATYTDGDELTSLRGKWVEISKDGKSEINIKYPKKFGDPDSQDQYITSTSAIHDEFKFAGLPIVSVPIPTLTLAELKVDVSCSENRLENKFTFLKGRAHEGKGFDRYIEAVGGKFKRLKLKSTNMIEKNKYRQYIFTVEWYE